MRGDMGNGTSNMTHSEKSHHFPGLRTKHLLLKKCVKRISTYPQYQNICIAAKTEAVKYILPLWCQASNKC